MIQEIYQGDSRDISRRFKRDIKEILKISQEILRTFQRDIMEIF